MVAKFECSVKDPNVDYTTTPFHLKILTHGKVKIHIKSGAVIFIFQGKYFLVIEQSFPFQEKERVTAVIPYFEKNVLIPIWLYSCLLVPAF